MINTPGSPEEWIKESQNAFSAAEIVNYITVERFLASRGFEVDTVGNGKDTLIPRENWSFEEASWVFKTFHDSNRREELNRYIPKPRKESHNPTSQLVKNLTSVSNFKREGTAFGHTFEWYVSELVKWKFQAFDAKYGVKVKNVREGNGDYDVLAVLGNLSLLYIECKTGRFDASAIEKVIRRSRDIHCTASIIFLGQKIQDDDLRDKLSDIENRKEISSAADKNQFHKLSNKEIQGGEIYQ